MLRVHILFEFREGPHGGANQFLKALRDHWVRHDLYSEDLHNCDVILFNSSPASFTSMRSRVVRLLEFKRRFPEKIIVNRIDGPIQLVRGQDAGLDQLFFALDQLVADGTIYQSMWSRGKCIEQGMIENEFATVIPNASDPAYFNLSSSNPIESGKIRVIATSWSPNSRKGFDIYKWLDENLDFEKYEMLFVGNSPIEFRNIVHIPPLPSQELVKQLKNSHLYLTASRNDPCSNSLIEALACGLPVIAFRGGGHPEIVGKAGFLFDDPSEIPNLLEKIEAHYEELRGAIGRHSFVETAEEYLNFMKVIREAVKSGKYHPKHTSFPKTAVLNMKIVRWALGQGLRRVCVKLGKRFSRDQING